MNTSRRLKRIKHYFPLFFGLIIFQSLMSCEQKKTPEMVVREWLTYMSEGQCDKAIALEYYFGEERRVMLNCEPYKSEIVSLWCNVMQETADCKCVEIRGVEREKEYSYDLKKVDGEWIITGFY